MMLFPLSSHLTLVVLICCVQASKSSSRLRIYHHSAPENALSSTSSLIVGKNEVMVVDAPFTNSATRELISFIKKITAIPVTKIFVTHEHPDHYFGGAEMLRAFPHASILASPEVSSRIEKTAQDKVKKWGPVYGENEITSQPVIPKPYTDRVIRLKGDEQEPIRLIQPLQGDIDDVTVVWIPTQRTLITGDLVYSTSQHAWMTEVQDESSRKDWLESLDFLESLKPLRVIGGHVPSGIEPKVSDIQGTREYLQYFNRHIIGNGYTSQKIMKKLTDRFPERQGFLLLNSTANVYGVSDS